MRTMTLFALSLLLAVSAHAGDGAKSESDKPAKAQLKALCSNCSIVTGVRTEQHKGRSTGVGAVGGAAAGGVVGKKVGDSTLSTIGGAVVGGLVGNEVERRVKRRTVWIVTTMSSDGHTRTTQLSSDPNLRSGDVVVPTADGHGLKRK